VPQPPGQLFRTVHYDSPAGKLAAYLSTSPSDGKKHPAIVWIFGGFDNCIGDTAWRKGPPANDQSASAYREAGIIMMYPSLRGGNDNPGFKEGFFGEVDDVLAAADYLAKQDFVDPKRIYLGGHSTGGTLALLAAESSGRFRAVFSFGPVDDVTGYGPQNRPFDISDRREVELRAPIRYLGAIQSPVFVFEGTDGNLASLQALSRSCRNPLVHFYHVTGQTHFSILGRVNGLIAGKVVRDDGPTRNLTFTEAEVNNLFAR
jgi:dipeptidyl aminopeptidase/acylaminoacyl peptidase